ncbi:hypothetical protein CCYA_CCYA09G2708 [Cyanidiococcus yangmingshanensis]|nr:hypothetical protein CCYA_CCYA09G2708 [Cyanidiococcus yangmingshanensis]
MDPYRHFCVPTVSFLTTSDCLVERLGKAGCKLHRERWQCVRPLPSHVLQTTLARKRKQKTKSSRSGSGSESSADSGPSRRFSRKMPLRQQLHLLREQAANERRLAARSTTQSFRRRASRATKEDEEEDKVSDDIEGENSEQAEKQGQQPRTLMEPLRQKWFFVDGYNVIGAIPELYAHVQSGDAEVARRLLIDDVTNLSAMRGWRCSVVFDAYMAPPNGAPRTRTSTEKIKTSLNDPATSFRSRWSSRQQHQQRAKGKSGSREELVEVVFPARKSADSYIIARVRETAHARDLEVWAATSDGIVQSLVRASGAYVISTDLFLREIENAKTEMRVIHRLANNEPSLALIDCLDEESKKKLWTLQNQDKDRASSTEATDSTE